MHLWIALIVFALAICGVASEHWIPVTESEAGAPCAVTVSAAGPDAWQVQVTMTGIWSDQLETEGTTEQILALPGQIPAPEPPLLAYWIGLRSDGDPALVVLTEDWIELEGEFDLAWSGDAHGALDVPADLDRYIPEVVCELSPRQMMGGVALASLAIAPVQYNPVRHSVRVLRAVTLQIREQGSPLPVRPITETTAQTLRPAVPNWDELALDENVVRGTLLYIMADNTVTPAALAGLVTWRRQKGYTVETAGPAQIGNPLTTQNVRTYIQNRYNQADPPLEFVCLVGDGVGTYVVPGFIYDDPTDPAEDGIGDYGYARLDGQDLLPDVAVGRLSFATGPALNTVVAKTLRYEQTPAPRTSGTRPNWYRAGAVVGDDDHQSYSVSHIQTMRWARERMLDAGFNSASIDTLYWTNYGGDIPSSAMNASLNAGAALWCYRGWNRMNNYAEDDVLGLTNVGHWPFMLLLTCNTNNFDDSDLAEAFMIPAAVPASPTGAIGVVGMSSGATHTRYNNILTSGAVQGLIREGVHTTGGSLLRSKLELRRNYPLTADSAVLGFFMGITNLMGDPAVDVYTATPDTLVLQPPGAMPVGTNGLALAVTNPQGQPQAGVYVNLVKGSEVFVGGTTDAAGQIILDFQAATPDTMWVTATRHNSLPVRAYTLVTTGSHVSPASQTFVLNDDNNGTSQGNSDGQANPGETIELALPLRNWGTVAASGVTAVLSTTDPFIASVPDNTETYGTISAGSTANPPDDFDFAIAPYAPHGHLARFTLTVTDDASHSWTSYVPITLSNAALDFVSLTLTGVGDGILNPGESGQLWTLLANGGTRSLPAGRVAYLRSEDRMVSVTDSIATFAAISSGGQGSNQADPWGVHAAVAALPGQHVPLLCIFPLSDGFADTVALTLTLGGVNAATPSPPDAYGYRAFDNSDTTYSLHPEFQWIEVDPAFGGAGTQLALADTIDGGDASIVVDLPFTFRYYGAEFDQITVCINGWLAMGADQVVHTDFRNYSMPSATAASGMLAPFWDDLRTIQHSLLPIEAVPPLDEGGEDCETAYTITSLPFSDTGYTCDNNNECGLISRDVMYRYTVPAGGQYLDISLCGSDFDTYLTLSTSCCGAPFLQDNNSCPDGRDSRITQNFPAGTIWILVEGIWQRCGDYTLNISGQTLMPPGHICTFHDAANHRFVVEWSRVFKFTGSLDPVETFQCILYEPGYPPTPTGDGEIVFQYLTCSNVTDVAESNDYATAGIENLDETDGVLYSYFNQVHPAIPGSASLSDGRAIRFTTTVAALDTPQTPAQLTLRAIESGVRLRWRAVTHDVRGNPLPDVHYNIYRGMQASFVPSAGTLIATVNDTTYDDALSTAAVYFYAVGATTFDLSSPVAFPTPPAPLPAAPRE